MLEELKEYFEERNDVAFAFIYGSYANGNATKLSDVDIAVYFYPAVRRPIECEEKNIYYPAENKIWGDIEAITKKETELLVLNRVPATIAASAIRGIPLAMNDYGLYLDFMEVITDVADSFEEMILRDYEERNKIAKRD